MGKKENRKLRSHCQQLVRSHRRKTLFRELGQDLLETPEGKEREQMLPVWEVRTFQTRMF
jgi:hypothetical protein